MLAFAGLFGGNLCKEINAFVGVTLIIPTDAPGSGYCSVMRNNIFICSAMVGGKGETASIYRNNLPVSFVVISTETKLTISSCAGLS